jgi:hypothetical protein
MNKQGVDLESYKEEIAQAESVTKQMQAEVAKMNIELQAPARIRLLESAEASLED